MFDFIYELFGTILSAFYNLTNSYAIALLLFALVFKLVFIPFGIKQQKNQIAMAKLRPKIAKIEKKYAGRTDRPTLEKKQREIMELQQQEGYSMLGGCLPLLLQFPLIIILYKIIREPLYYVCKLSEEAVSAVATLVGGDVADQIGMIDKIETFIANNATGANQLLQAGLDVETLPDFSLFGANLAATPSFKNFSFLILIPVLAAAFQWLSMFLSRRWMGNTQMPGAEQDPQTQLSMKMMDLMMPAMTLFFAFSFSAMLGLYWIYQSVLGIAQSYILAKTMPIPRYTAEELKEIEKAEKEKQKAQKAAIKQQPKYKSLHYIDEDDYDTLPDVKKTPDSDKKSLGGIEGGKLK